MEQDAFERLERLLVGKIATGGPQKLGKGKEVTSEYLRSFDPHFWFDIRLADEEASTQLEQVRESVAQKRKTFDVAFEEKEKEIDARG